MPACRHCHHRDAAPWDPDELCPRCRRVQEVAIAKRVRVISADRRTPSLPGLDIPRKGA